jgi:hypothetical protein
MSRIAHPAPAWWPHARKSEHAQGRFGSVFSHAYAQAEPPMHESENHFEKARRPARPLSRLDFLIPQMAV